MKVWIQRTLHTLGIIFVTSIAILILADLTEMAPPLVFLVSLIIGFVIVTGIAYFFKSNAKKVAWGFLLSFFIFLGLYILFIILGLILSIVGTFGMVLLAGTSNRTNKIFYLIISFLVLVSFPILNTLIIKKVKNPFRKKGFIGGYIFILWTLYKIIGYFI